MNKKSDNEWALITGASSGIGLSCAHELAKRGYKLVLVARNTEKLEKARKSIVSKYDIEVEALSFDLAKISKIDDLCENLFKKKTFSILVNNAGMSTSNRFHDESWEKLEKIAMLNSLAPMKLIHHFIPHFLQHKKQSYILNIASLASHIPMAYNGNYSATKSYLDMLSQSIREELKSTNISLTSSCPGGVDTNFMAANQGADLTKSAKTLSRSPENIAKISIKAMFSKRIKIVPGIEHSLVFLLKGLLPNTSFTSLANKVIHSSRDKVN